ncbi:aminotransferase class I/II-fold pyridoxal phosphate-dependent enzyme [Riemerella anatipestifer]|uniref:aminotransferase class I/II-fold pyridoxal phosphate-dependent enzyme n=1 Tax=Riemerella anatipestifer TaxID=34085 RepID=UPI002097B3B3|nr:aminotransferase class I/II-fold pyridoxal phosphate-dependent enzyme [Riemerella anatipestifer]MCO7317917.1 aminotransferase class I/II-fold pyridoxal phosphate-dependent enzyme [Riemerella anatipestifer]MCW0473312.1 aminotransferase class I/II-fold pyridoxal phosphate-dependent enzyme [Riemerella anatipestifer]MDY3396279.1 aminotransferase class I/II-fold pyridoxal phosphate-dependent enzyme [Riemerella anatipestifer]MDY3409042.1 aminotransferase class I/II-fold pyridoxal phosphate-depende
MNTKIWLSSPHMGGNEQKYINEAFAENWVAPLGPNVNQFEESIKTYLGQSVDVAALSAGTAALHLALIILGVKMGDEVICQSMTFSASANPIAYQGATPVFIDSEKETWNMCPLALKDAIKERLSKGKKPKAIIVVHLYGMPAKMDELMAVASKYEIPIIEDAAEALGSSYKGQKCGTFGEMSILSFNGNKIITTSGGGALLCQTSAQKEKAVFLSTQARDNAPHYQHSEIGYNYRMSNICAGIGCGQMEVLDERISQRRANHQFYIDLFKNIEGVEVFTEPSEDYFSNHWLSAIVIDPQKAGFSREDLRLKFLEDNIESRPLWKPMHLQPVFADTPYYGGQVAQRLFENGLCLPSGSNLTDADRQRISEVVYKLKS